MAETMTGGCACGQVRFEAEVDNDEAYLCHCRMCQRATGNVSVAFKNLKKAKVRWLSDPNSYESSPIASRPYCRHCGTSLGFQYPDSENMDLAVAAFDDPSRFRPKHHFGVESMQRAWTNTDGLPEYRVTDNPRTVEHWHKAGCEVPD
jgi:hypothetical protein